jgi:hypothetical protein
VNLLERVTKNYKWTLGYIAGVVTLELGILLAQALKWI